MHDTAVGDDTMNRDYDPTDDDHAILDAMASEPCGRVNPYLLRDETGLSKQRVSNSLRQLVAAGWVTKRTRALYDLEERAEHDDYGPCSECGGSVEAQVEGEYRDWVCVDCGLVVAGGEFVDD